jgi:hypothetical protein
MYWYKAQDDSIKRLYPLSNQGKISPIRTCFRNGLKMNFRFLEYNLMIVWLF